MKWSERYIGEWRHFKEEVFDALAMMINQYNFVAKPLSEEEYQALRSAIHTDWRTALQHISANRISTSLRAWESDEVEAMLVSVHCLAVICWDKLYNKFEPEFAEDVRHDAMSAGEHAIGELVRFGLMTTFPLGGKWTATGIDMLNGKLR